MVTVESTPEEPGVPPSHFLQMYSYAVGESDDGSDEPAVVNPKPLSLSAGALSLAVCPLTGKIVILLQNGVLIVLECIDDGFELVLEMVSGGRSVVRLREYFSSSLCVYTIALQAYSGVLLTAAAVYDRFLCVASSSEGELCIPVSAIVCESHVALLLCSPHCEAARCTH